MEFTSIYDYLYHLIIKAKDRKFFLSAGLGATLSDWAEDDIHQYKYLKDKSEEEIVLVALDHPNDFDVYLFRHGIYWDRTYIICKHNLSPIQIYKCLGIEESMSFNRFLYDTFRVDSEGDASKTALAKEINMPRYMIFDGTKVSYYLDEDDSEFNYYTTLHGNKISYEDLDNFQTQNHGFLKGKEISAIESNFNVTPEEAEDILINYYNKGKLTEAKQIKKLYSYGGPVYRFDKVYLNYWEAETYAVSKKEAIRNFNQQAKRYFGFIPSTNMNIDPSYVLCEDDLDTIDNSDNQETSNTPTRDKCDKCGRDLNDNGECPLCDLGDESVLDETLNESTNIDGEDSLYQNINSDKLLVTNTKKAAKNSNFTPNKGMKADSKHPRTEDVIRNHKYFTFNQSYKDFNIYSPIKFIRIHKRNNSSMAGPFYKDTNINDYCAYKDNILVAYDKNLDTLKQKIDDMVIFENLHESHQQTTLKSDDVYSVLPSEKEELLSMTPYMLRNDGELLTCGDLHPYIKMSNSAPFETNLNTLNNHPEFLDWFYDNTLNEEVKTLITEYKECKNEEKEELMNLLNDLTNQEFCRVRTSNYKVKYGGDNGQIYFRISSTGFNWFDLIWNIVNKFSKNIKEVTIMKDKQTFGGKEFDYYYNHLPIDEFLTLKGNPIVESIDSNIKDNLVNEDIEKHDTLNTELFEQNELKKDVKETIENIADLFVEELAEQDIKFKLKDIILLGSNVSYNYTKDSDLDVHLIADSKNLKCPDDLYPLLYGAYVSLFNKNYDITIKGIPVELYVEIDESTAKSNGIYSLTKGWIKEPVQTDIPDIDFDQFNVEFKTWEDRYLDIINNKLPENKNKSEIIKDFISDLYDLRKQSITKDGEYGLGNLIFKEFRNKGYLDYLKDQRKVEKGKELSLEGLQEDIDTDNLDKLNKTIKQLSDAGVDWEIESNLDDEYSENIIILNDMEDIARAIIKSIYGNCYIRLFDLDRKLPYFKVMNS